MIDQYSEVADKADIEAKKLLSSNELDERRQAAKERAIEIKKQELKAKERAKTGVGYAD